MEKIGDTRATLTGHPRRSETQACRYGRIHSQRIQPLFQSYLSEDVVWSVEVVVVTHADEKSCRSERMRERTAKIQKIHRFVVRILRILGRFGYSLCGTIRNTKIMVLSTN